VPIPDPTPENVVAIRRGAGLTQAQAAALVNLATFQRWSEYERGVVPVDPARWELFLIKTGQHPHFGPYKGVPVPKAKRKE
jgi:DNA-binding transcriptional regulator YiaG